MSQPAPCKPEIDEPAPEEPVSREIKDLREFNERIREGQEARRQQGPPVEATSIELDAHNARLWAVSGDAYLPCEEAVKALPPGHYIVLQSQTKGVYLKRQEFSIDNLLELPDSASEEVIAEIEHFWTLENHFRKYGFLWKRGMMLWGPPGSGKTSTVQILAKKIVDRGGIAVSIYAPTLAIVGMHIIRKIEPKRPIIGILEDIDAIVYNHGEADLLALLDGENQIDNVVYLATTNYPEKLDPRFINRPSRFDVIKKISMPSTEARAVFLAAKSRELAGSRNQLEKWVRDTEGLSVAHLKELIISVEVFGSDYDLSLERLKTMMDCDLDSREDRSGTMGFKHPGTVPPDLVTIIDKVLAQVPDQWLPIPLGQTNSGFGKVPGEANDDYDNDDHSDPDTYDGSDYGDTVND